MLVAPDGCRLQELDLAHVVLGDPGVETLCRAWVSPVGGQAVVESGSSDSPGAREIELVRLGSRPEAIRALGVALGPVAWSRDGARIAWCRPGGGSTVHDLASGREQVVPGCDPRFAPDGSVLTLPVGALRQQILRDGQVELDDSDLARGFPASVHGPIDVLQYDVAASGVIAVAVVIGPGEGTRTVLELWRGRRLEATIKLPTRVGAGLSRFGELVRFSPTGSELAIGSGTGPGQIAFLDLALRKSALVTVARSFAWSPDGMWLALAVGSRILVYGAVRDEPIYTLPVATATLGWVGPAPKS